MKEISDFFKRHDLPLNKCTLVLAVSGGPDSMALLGMLLKTQKEYHYHLIVAHFDHQLRSDSAEEWNVITQFCQQKPVTLVNKKWQRSSKLESGIEAAARKARYQFLVAVVNKYHGDYLLTAHHNDDLLENILLKFIRSGNPSEMVSLKEVGQMADVALLRPLFSWSKEQLLSYVKQEKIPYVVDQTNQEDDTLRNRLRHHVLPLLKKENPALSKSALTFSQQTFQLLALTNQRFAQLPRPKSFLGLAYRLPKEALDSLNYDQQNLFWQNFIWQTWHYRVNANLAGFSLLVYQNYYYLIKHPLPKLPLRVSFNLEQEFTFNQRHFVLSAGKKDNNFIGEIRVPPKASLSAGAINVGSRLKLKNGQHAKSKKKFAQAAIPAILRPFCLSIFAQDEVVFIEKVYQNQTFSVFDKCYYLYEIINKN